MTVHPHWCRPAATAAPWWTGTWCEDAWLTTVALAQHTEGLKFLVALRSGGDSAEQRRIEHFVLSGYPRISRRRTGPARG